MTRVKGTSQAAKKKATARKPKPKIEERSGEVVEVKVPLLTISPDPNQYKPYNPFFAYPAASDKVIAMIMVPVPKEYVLKQKPELVLTVDGMGWMAKYLATALRKWFTATKL